MHVLTEVDPAEIARLRERDEFFWIDLSSPTDEDVERLGEALGLHPVALEDTREFGQRPKLDPYGDHLLLVFYTARVTGDPNGRPSRSRSTSTSPAASWSPCAATRAMRSTTCTRSSRDEGTHDEEMLVYRLLDALTDAYYPVIEAIEASVDALEGEVLHRPAARAADAAATGSSSACTSCTGCVAAQRDQFQTAREAILGLEGLTKGSRPYLRDIGDHLVQVAGEFQRQLEDLMALTQTYFNANSDRLNAVATRLTIGGTLFVLYTVVTGFFGQNFGWLVDNIDTKTRLPDLRRRRARGARP